jgi:hypothetical protein
LILQSPLQKPYRIFATIEAHVPAAKFACMEPDADRDIELPSSNEKGDVSSHISPEQFQLNCLEYPTCYRLSQEAHNTLQRAKVPRSWPDEFRLFFHELESTWKACPLCYLLYEIVHGEGSYIHSQRSLAFSECTVEAAASAVEDTGEWKSDNYLVELYYSDQGQRLRSKMPYMQTNRVLSRCDVVVH